MADSPVNDLPQKGVATETDALYLVNNDATATDARVLGSGININLAVTDGEDAVSVVPTDARYVLGDVRRYGAVGDDVTDDTTAIQNAIDVSVGESPNANNAWTAVYLPAGIYRVSNITLPPRVVLIGDSKDVSIIKQLSTATGVMVTHNAEAISVGNLGKTLIQEITFHGNDNGNDWVVELGSASAGVFWGNESILKRVSVINNSGGGGLYIRPNVSYVEDLECTASDTNLEVAGSNLYASHILTNQVTNNGVSMLLSGDSHRIFGYHSEESTNSTSVTAIQVTGQDNLVVGPDFSAGDSTTVDCIDIDSGALRNRFIGMRYLTAGSGAFGDVINDATTTKATVITNEVFDYSQQTTTNPILEIGNADLTSNAYALASDTSEQMILWTGDNDPTVIRLPRTTNTFREVTVMNGSSVALIVNRSTADAGDLFYGESFVTLQPDETAVFNTDGTNWYMVRGVRGAGQRPNTFTAADATPSVATSNVWLTDTGTLTITDLDDGESGQIVTILSKGAVTFDTTGTNLNGSASDIVTADGDTTQWLCEDGTSWYLLGFVDSSLDNSGGA